MTRKISRMPRRQVPQLCPRLNFRWTKPLRYLLNRKKSPKPTTKMKPIPIKTTRISTMKTAIPKERMSSAKACHRPVPISNYPLLIPIRRKVSILHRPLGYRLSLPLFGENCSPSLVFLSVSVFDRSTDRSELLLSIWSCFRYYRRCRHWYALCHSSGHVYYLSNAQERRRLLCIRGGSSKIALSCVHACLFTRIFRLVELGPIEIQQ